MAALATPVCDFGQPAPDFNLPGVDGRLWSLAECMGKNGLLVMFICQHCPYVQAIHDRIVRDSRELLAFGVASVAIMANDTSAYPEDSFANMQQAAVSHHYPFPYLWDETQAVARAYGAVCTPDFFGYNADFQLQYRGRLDASRREAAPADTIRELFIAMQTVAATGHGPVQQTASIGCNIKWKTH
ncbi:MAG: thioredoxin family protein [Methylovulum sp.]|nr:thioredoxin family protein [Methylovulum sp.]